VPEPCDGWTIKALKEYCDNRFSSTEKAAALVSADLARRLDGMNEFRGTLSDQATRFLSIETYEAQHRALDEKVNGVSARLTIVEARALGASALFGYLIAAVTAIAAIATTIIVLTRH
jgi:hypothetical protein